MKKTITSGEYYDELVDYIVANWKTNGTVTNEDNTRETINELLWLKSNYCPECLVATIKDIGELEEKFGEKMKNVEVEETKEYAYTFIGEVGIVTVFADCEDCAWLILKENVVKYDEYELDDVEEME